MDITDEIKRAAEILARSSHTAATTGAGISEESGINTFRDAGGIWDRLNPAEVGTAGGLVSAIEKNAEKLAPFFMELLSALESADPNPGHLALAELETMGILKTVITQNIDNLHWEAGNTDVIEVHGNGFRLRCTSCEKTERRHRRQLLQETMSLVSSVKAYSLTALIDIMPKCIDCNAIMRPDVVMFGEMVQDLPRAFAAATACDVLLALGTSGVVYPAAQLPYEAKKSGAAVIVINPHENPFSRVSDVYIPMKTGEALPEIVATIRTIIRDIND